MADATVKNYQVRIMPPRKWQTWLAHYLNVILAPNVIMKSKGRSL